MTPRDRIVGGLMGLLVGDALGVPVEFSARQSRDLDPVVGMRGFGVHNQPAGTWSDDGALTLAHAAAFADHGWQPVAHLQEFLAWLDQARWTAGGVVFDVGNATRNALMRFRLDLPLEEVGGRTEHDNGNGSLMRILPASCWWFGTATELLIANLGAASALTYGHLRAQLCCALHGLLVTELFSDRPLVESLVTASARLRRHVPPAERAILAPLLDGSILAWDRARVPSDGYVVSTLMASCWCLHRYATFPEAVQAAVNLGGDTDTTGAVVGGLAGIRCGLAGIPSSWIEALPRCEEILALAHRFADACVAQWASEEPLCP